MPPLLIANTLAANLGLQRLPDDRRAGRPFGSAHLIDQLQKALVDGHPDSFHDR